MEERTRGDQMKDFLENLLILTILFGLFFLYLFIVYKLMTINVLYGVGSIFISTLIILACGITGSE